MRKPSLPNLTLVCVAVTACCFLLFNYVDSVRSNTPTASACHDKVSLKLSDDDETLRTTVRASWHPPENRPCWLPGAHVSGWVDITNTGRKAVGSTLLTVQVVTSGGEHPDSESGDPAVHNIDDFTDVTELSYDGEDILAAVASALGDGEPPLTLGELDEALHFDLEALTDGVLAQGETSRLSMTLHLRPETGNDYQGDVVSFDFTFDAGAQRPQLGTRTLGYYKNHDCVLGVLLRWWPLYLDGERISVDDALSIFEEEGTPRDRMKRQLLVTKLNIRAFGIGLYDLLDIGEPVVWTVVRAEALLRSDASNEELSGMNDLLDSINNYGDDVPLPDWLRERCPHS
jgi:hypothetical protein